jgi:hypothetical protein
MISRAAGAAYFVFASRSGCHIFGARKSNVDAIKSVKVTVEMPQKVIQTGGKKREETRSYPK